ncbi:MAG: hypothetical protein AAF483_15945 [Planctomycetota bacterium]
MSKKSIDAKYRLLGMLVLLQLLIYLWIGGLSQAFEYGSDGSQRPIPLVLGLFSTCFFLHLVGLWQGLRVPSDRNLVTVILFGAILFRATLFWSTQIQEVDIYRYCWDGAVLAEGVSPFRYSPARVLEARQDEKGMSEELRKLVQLKDSDPAQELVLSRVHFGELTTIYPPTSQFVFAAAAGVTPQRVSLTTRLRVMKAFVLFFDLMTLFVLSRFLSLLSIHQAWAIPYAWSPLVLKEFANSGHLDSIAVFFCVTSVYLLCKFLTANQTELDSRKSYRPAFLLGCAVSMALGIGAKLFPVILCPLMGWVLYRTAGLKTVLVWCVGIFLASILTLGPMILEMQREAPDAHFVQDITPDLPSSFLSSPGEIVESQIQNGGLGKASIDNVSSDLPNDDGLVEFLSRWEMNDLLFMMVEENLRPRFSARAEPWFIITPKRLRQSICERLAAIWSLSEGQVPFRLTRLLLSVAFLVVVAWLVLRIPVQELSEKALCLHVLQTAFLIVAWFWLLSPTQNPWYWTWAIPFVVFARSRIWLAIGGLVMSYYLRFWFLYNFTDLEVCGTGYVGTDFFDYVVVWLEFAPWFAVLLWVTMRRDRGQSTNLVSMASNVGKSSSVHV